MVDSSYFYVKVNGDPKGEIEWHPADVTDTKHLRNDDIVEVGWDDDGRFFTRCAEHPDLIQGWYDTDDWKELAIYGLRRILAEEGLDSTTYGNAMWQRPWATIEEGLSYEEKLSWEGYTFEFEVSKGNQIICTGLVLHPKPEGAPSRAETIAKLESAVLGRDIVAMLAFDDYLSG